MLNKKKIIIMSKLAVYDKNNGEADRKVNQYFRHDYIYRKNMWNRFYAFIGAIIILAVYWSHQIIIKKIDIFSLDYHKELLGMGKFIIIILVFYTIIGTIKATAEYAACKRRLSRYYKLINQLDRIRDNAEDKIEGASNNGTGISGKRIFD